MGFVSLSPFFPCGRPSLPFALSAHDQAAQVVELRRREWLGEDVGNHRVGFKMIELYVSFFYCFTKVAEARGDVLEWLGGLVSFA